MYDNEKRPQDPFEAVSYDLNKFRERRVTDRRFQACGTPDRRCIQSGMSGEPIVRPWNMRMH